MADIAAVFHWPLSEMDALRVDELAEWRSRAIARWPWAKRKETDG